MYVQVFFLLAVTGGLSLFFIVSELSIRAWFWLKEKAS